MVGVYWSGSGRVRDSGGKVEREEERADLAFVILPVGPDYPRTASHSVQGLDWPDHGLSGEHRVAGKEEKYRRLFR